ncbi:MAG: glycosyltransferase family 4 protein [Promethearchaeota archaeon]
MSLAVYPDSKDGSAKFARGIFDGLKRRGHDITLITSQWTGTLDDPDIHQIPVPRGRFFWLPSYVLGAFKRILGRNYDVLHGNGSRGSLPCILARKPYITTIHDLGPFEASFTKVPIVPVIEKVNATRARRIVTCSKIVHRGINHYVPSASLDKMHCVYSAIDPRFRPDPGGAEKIRERLGLNGPVIFYVGRIAFYKGVEHIISAFESLREKHPEYQLVVGGKPTFKMQETYDRWKQALPHVKFVGLIPDEDLPAYYTMADTFVTYSSASEGFGLTPVESIACGTPVVCSSMAAYREVLQDHAYFVPPNSPRMLATTLESVLEDREGARKMVERARGFITRYTWDAVIDRLEGVYYDYLENP